MSAAEDLYRVIYKDRDGREQLTDAMPLDAARSRALDLEGQGYAVGSVMGDVAARGYMHARHAPTYRGVDIPLDLRADGVPRRALEAWKRDVDAELDGPKPKPSANGPETYRCIPVPDRIQRDRDEKGRYSALFHAWREGVDAALGVAVPLVESLSSDSECFLDHHGYCQEHGLPGAIPCPDGEARKFLAATKEGKTP